MVEYAVDDGVGAGVGFGTGVVVVEIGRAHV